MVVGMSFKLEGLMAAGGRGGRRGDLGGMKEEYRWGDSGGWRGGGKERVPPRVALKEKGKEKHRE